MRASASSPSRPCSLQTTFAPAPNAESSPARPDSAAVSPTEAIRNPPAALLETSTQSGATSAAKPRPLIARLTPAITSWSMVVGDCDCASRVACESMAITLVKVEPTSTSKPHCQGRLSSKNSAAVPFGVGARFITSKSSVAAAACRNPRTGIWTIGRARQRSQIVV